MRHPVQLYESFAMAAFALVYSVALVRKDQWVIANGFALVVLFYGTQRFIWEFLKPYASLIGGLTLFHFVSAILIAYGLIMLRPFIAKPVAAQ
jgi:phosphatidylglycerol---prolipoprotein diacylglyceryl transferase